jgi:hypothetical protein
METSVVMSPILLNLIATIQLKIKEIVQTLVG